MAKRMIQIVTAFVVVYLLFAGLMFIFQRNFIYIPSPDVPDPSGHGVPEMSVVRLSTEDGLELRAWWHAPRDAIVPVVVYFHGNAGHIGYRAPKVRPFLDRGFGVLLVEYRGYGGNPGSPSEEGLYADAAAAAVFLEEQGLPSQRWILFGESLGSGVAVELASRTRVRGMVLEAPFSSLIDVAATRFPFFPLRLMMWDHYDSTAKIARIDTPIVIFHGENDGIVPISLGRRLFEAARDPKQFFAIAEAGHNDLFYHGIMDTAASLMERMSNGRIGRTLDKQSK